MMTKLEIQCPHCGNPVSLSEAMRAEVAQDMQAAMAAERARLQAEHKKEFNTLKEKLEAEQTAAVELLRRELEEKSLKIQQSNKAQAELQIQLENIKQKETELDLEAERRAQELLKSLITKERADADRKAKQQMQLQIGDLQAQLEESRVAIEIAQKAELELRAKTREVEARAKTTELEIQRKLEEERTKIIEEATTAAAQVSELKMIEKSTLIDSLKKQLEDTARKAQAGSQQLQGEAFEIQLAQMLAEHFPMDQIEEVRKGANGADVIQRVMGKNGCIGTILWEAKRTKHWQTGWTDKMKTNLREANAQVGAIVSHAAPSELRGLGIIDGVFVAEPRAAFGIAEILRRQVVELAHTKTVEHNRIGKEALAYEFLTGQKNRQRTEAMIDLLRGMMETLNRERAVTEKSYSAREEQIRGFARHLAATWGDIEGMLGSANVPKIPFLELNGE